MTAKAGADIAAVLATYDFSRFRRIADIGGGRGHLLRAILDATPDAEGVLFDLPGVIDSLDFRDEPRLTTQAGDFFVDALPAADAYLLMDVLHDWPGAESAKIPVRGPPCRPRRFGVLIVEDVLADDPPGPRSCTSTSSCSPSPGDVNARLASWTHC